MNKHTDHQRSTNFIKAIRCAVLDTSKTIGDDDVSEYCLLYTSDAADE